jgi:hypothetical protein
MSTPIFGPKAWNETIAYPHLKFTGKRTAHREPKVPVWLQILSMSGKLGLV